MASKVLGSLGRPWRHFPGWRNLASGRAESEGWKTQLSAFGVAFFAFLEPISGPLSRPDSGARIGSPTVEGRRTCAGIRRTKVVLRNRPDAWLVPKPDRRVQAEAVWQWSNFLEAQNNQNSKRPVLRVNMDETSVKLDWESRRGLVMVPEGCKLRDFLKNKRKSKLNSRRSALSLVAFVCDDSDKQRLLPQVFVGNAHVLTLAAAEHLFDATQDNVFVLRRNSAWVTTALLVEIVALLAECLKDVLETHYVILSMDACRVHLAGDVADACARAGIHIMYIAASTTAFLQPLDTHVFAKYKRWLWQAVESKQLSSADGALTHVEMMELMCAGIQVLEGQSWATAFAHDGLCGQASLSKSLKSRLQIPAGGAPSVPCCLPTLEQLQAIWPKGADIPVHAIFQLVERESLAKGKDLADLGLARATELALELRTVPARADSPGLRFGAPCPLAPMLAAPRFRLARLPPAVPPTPPPAGPSCWRPLRLRRLGPGPGTR